MVEPLLSLMVICGPRLRLVISAADIQTAQTKCEYKSAVRYLIDHCK